MKQPSQPENGSLPARAGKPPRWAESLLRSLLAPGDRESILGDLLEEYRESILPRAGRRGADLWYLRQVAGIVWHLSARGGRGPAGGARYGLALGLFFSLAIVLVNVVFPLAGLAVPDTPLADLTCWSGVLFLFAAAGFAARRRTGALHAAIASGALVAFVSFALAMLTFVVVDNVFLDIVSRQPEKIWLFQHSGYRSMRAYVNHSHLKALVFVLPVLTLLGAVLGALGGIAGAMGRPGRPHGAAGRPPE